MANSKNSNSSSTSFWVAIVLGFFIYYVSDSATAAITAGLFLWLVVLAASKGVKKAKALQESAQPDTQKKFVLDFDALSPSYKATLLKQQFDAFFGYRLRRDGQREFYCIQDELDGYHFAMWVDFAPGFNGRDMASVKAGQPICTVYVSSNKGADFGYQSFYINADENYLVTKQLNGMLHKGSAIFSVQEDTVSNLAGKTYEHKTPATKTVYIAEEDTATETHDVNDAKTATFYDYEGLSEKPEATFYEAVTEVADDSELQVPEIDTHIEVEAASWDEIPSIKDIEVPSFTDKPKATNGAYQSITITNLSDFDWHNAIVVFINGDEHEPVELGDVSRGSTVSVECLFSEFLLTAADGQGGQKRTTKMTADRFNMSFNVTTIFWSNSDI